MEICISTSADLAPPAPPLEIAVSEKLAPGLSTSLIEANVWQTETLTPESWWGNDYMHARYYSPTLARFVSVDPIGGSIGSSQSWNRYSYVENSPIMLVDPDGRASLGSGTETAIRQHMDAAEVEQFNKIQAEVEPKLVAAGMAAGAVVVASTLAATPEAVVIGTSVMLNPRTPQVLQGTGELLNPNPGPISPSKLVPTQALEQMSKSQVTKMAKTMMKDGTDAFPNIEVVGQGGKLFVRDGHHRAPAAAAAGQQIGAKLVQGGEQTSAGWSFSALGQKIRSWIKGK